MRNGTEQWMFVQIAFKHRCAVFVALSVNNANKTVKFIKTLLLWSWVTSPCSIYRVAADVSEEHPAHALKKEAVYSFETFVTTYQTALCRKAEDRSLNHHLRINLRSYTA